MDLQVAIHADQPQQRDTDVHVHVKEVAYHLTHGGAQVPDISLAVVEDPEWQAHHQQQVCKSHVYEEHPHRVLLGVNAEEHPQSHHVSDQTEDKDYTVEHSQWDLQSFIIHTSLLRVRSSCRVNPTGPHGDEKKRAVWNQEGGCNRFVFWGVFL